MIAFHHDETGYVRVHTAVGVPVGTRPRLSPEAKLTVRARLERGAFLAAFEAFGAAGVIESRPRAYRINGVLTRGRIA